MPVPRQRVWRAARRRVWRAAPSTLAVVWVFAIVAGVCIPLLAYLMYVRERSPLIPAVLGGLTLLALVYAWRFGLHPALVSTRNSVIIKNPLRTTAVEWQDITLITPGENGLLIGTDDDQFEAWCIQKSNHAAKHGKLTRADKITTELLDHLDRYLPPVRDEETGILIRRARPDEEELLMWMEKATSEANLAHIFPPSIFPYPNREVAKRWRSCLRSRLIEVRVLERFDEPIGYIAFDQTTVLHLGVLPDHTNRGFGSALLQYATREMFAGGVSTIELWVLEANSAARRFYASAGWEESGETRDCKFAPHPEEMRMTHSNDRVPRRSLV